MKCSIIIPYYNKWDLVHNRLMEIYKNISECEIILIDDDSPNDDCRTGAAWWQKQVAKHSIRYYKNEKNLGFGGSMNIGAKIAIKNGADILILLSNDVSCRGDFVTPIIAALSEKPKTLIGGELIYHPAGWNEFQLDNGNKFIVPYANGWLLACTTDAWKEFGGFDPIYGRYDYEDVDLSTKALSLGYSVIGLHLPFLHHQGAGTIGYNPERLKHTEENRLKYINKWKPKFEDIFLTLEKKDAN